jgi:hypothetical protein
MTSILSFKTFKGVFHAEILIYSTQKYEPDQYDHSYKNHY